MDDLALAKFLIPSWLHLEQARMLADGPQATDTLPDFKRDVIRRLNKDDARRWLRQPRSGRGRFRKVLLWRIFGISDPEPSWSQ
jgi:hypothetical protein